MFSIVTFNVRMPWPSDGVNFFPYRLPMITDKIMAEKPDLVCFQELTQDSWKAMSVLLPEYTFFGSSREKDLSGESTRIAYRRERFELVSGDHFWLSDTPHVPGSRYADQSDCPRVADMVRLYDQETGNQFFAINTHLDHRSDSARQKGLQQIFDYIAVLNAEEMPVFLTGDFNFTPDDPAYKLIEKNQFSDLTSGISDSYHGYGTVTGDKIDYILYHGPAQKFSLSVWHEERDSRFLSDHDAVCIKC